MSGATVDLYTEDKLQYTFMPNSSGYLRFKVRCRNDAHIALTRASAECDPMFEVFIGGWGNQKSVIRKNRAKPDVAEVQTPYILNGGEFRGFWIRWDKNTISCGLENNPQAFIMYTDIENILVHYVGFCTGWGANGNWIIYQDSAPPGNYGGGAQVGGYPPTAPYGGYGGGAPYGGFGGGAPPLNYGGGVPPLNYAGGAPPLNYVGGSVQHGNFGGGAPFGDFEVVPRQFVTPNYGFNPSTNKPRWVSASNGNVPPGAFVGGNDHGGEPLYVIRCKLRGCLIPGKLHQKYRTAYVPWGGAEHEFNQYEVLCDFGGRWVACSGANIPPNALVAGQNDDYEALYVGRVRHEGALHVGKVQKSHNGCYISYGGKELHYPRYEILVS